MSAAERDDQSKSWPAEVAFDYQRERVRCCRNSRLAWRGNIARTIWIRYHVFAGILAEYESEPRNKVVEPTYNEQLANARPAAARIFIHEGCNYTLVWKVI